MPTDNFDEPGDGPTVITLAHDEAAIVLGPDGGTMYLHKQPDHEEVSMQNRVAAALGTAARFFFADPDDDSDSDEDNNTDDATRN